MQTRQQRTNAKRVYISTGRAFINLRNSCSYCDEIITCNGLVVVLVPSRQQGLHSLLIYVRLQPAMVLILRVVNPMKTDKQIENICKEHVPNVILELSGKSAEVCRENLENQPHVLLFLGRRRIAVNNGVDFGATPVSAKISMRSKPVTQSNGVVVRKSSIRMPPNVTQQCRCSPILIFRAWATCDINYRFPACAQVPQFLVSCSTDQNSSSRWKLNFTR